MQSFDECHKSHCDKAEPRCASDTLRQDTFSFPKNVDPTNPFPEVPSRTTDDRACELIRAWNNPPRDQALLYDRLVRTFAEEQLQNGFPGMECLADKINHDTCAGLYVDRFRGGKVYALYFNYKGQDVELPIVGRVRGL